MRYRLLLHVDVDAGDDREAAECAKKLGALIKNPFVKMTLQGDGIRPLGEAVIYQPQRDPPPV